MQTDGSAIGSGATPAFSRDVAFVVHLTCAAGQPAGVLGRVEHVTTGRVGRFESADDLVRFMRQTLAAIAADGG